VIWRIRRIATRSGVPEIWYIPEMIVVNDMA
jgi:hypothetical protein